jgi:hypothetical protein
LLEAQAAPAAELAHHALAAGRPDAAFRHSLAAGDAAIGLFAVRDALGHYERARELLPLPPNPPRIGTGPADLERLYGQMGRAYELDGALAQARAAYQAWLAAAEAAQSPAMAGAALNRLATLALHDRMDVPIAIELIQRVVERASASDDRLALAEAEWNLAQLGYYILTPRRPWSMVSEPWPSPARSPLRTWSRAA